MKYLNFIIGLSVFAIYACTDSSIDIVPTDETIITGNICTLAHTPTGTSTNVSSTLSKGSIALLNASGSLQADNRIITFSGVQWNSDIPINWSDREGTATVVALYPAHENFTYTYENLYKEGKLEDILFAKGSFPYKEKINFQFKHLFSLISFHVANELQSELQEIELTTPVTVSAISTTTSEVTFAPDTSYTSSLLVNASGDYDFIIPPTNMSLSLTIKLKEKTITKQLEVQAFAGNTRYECNIESMDKQPGITTAEDLIAFSQLINGKACPSGKTLDDFRKINNTDTIYQLLKDIELTNEDCKQLMPIGYYNKRAFSNIFDGQEHTIYNLTPNSYGGESGLFGQTNKNSIIRNLHLANTNLTQKGSLSHAALLVSYNKGTIQNCCITNCKVGFTEGSICAGMLAGISFGNILNCYVLNCPLSAGKQNCIGAFVGILEDGAIINSYSVNNKITISPTSHAGGFCGQTNDNKEVFIKNCYVQSASSQSQTRFGSFIGIANHSIIEHSFYNYGNVLYGENNNSQITRETYPYNSDFTYNGNLSVLSSLNEWIDTNFSLYPNFEFKRWTKGNGTTIPAIFIEK